MTQEERTIIAIRRNLTTLRDVAGGLSLVLLAIGIVVMVWAGSWRVVGVVACASVQAPLIGAILSLTKRNGYGSILVNPLLSIIVLIPAVFVVPGSPWWLQLAGSSIVFAGAAAGIAIGARLLTRRVSAPPRQSR